MEDIIKKADVLIEALPYIKNFYNKIVVIKYGGAAMTSREIRQCTLQDIVFMNYVGMHPVLVHGAGPLISQKMTEKGKKAQFVDGVRVTDEETIKIVEKVLTQVNEEIVSELNSLGARAQGLGGGQKNIFEVEKKKVNLDMGNVGSITGIDTVSIKDLLNGKIIPVIMPLGRKDDKFFNINADEAASELAHALSAEKLVLLTDVKGILINVKDTSSLMNTLTIQEAKDLIKRNVIQQGMIPKVNACIKALEGGAAKTHIIDGRIIHSLLLEIFTDEGIGTEIVKGQLDK